MIRLPIVEYTIDGQSYKVIGPKFKQTIIKSVSKTFNNVESKIESNLTTRENRLEGLRININKN